MDLFYSRWTPKTRALVDLCTVGFLFAYLVFLLYGGISSVHYALEYNETSYSAWSPRMAPIKIVMCIGIALMLLQVLAIFFKDLAAVARGDPVMGYEYDRPADVRLDDAAAVDRQRVFGAIGFVARSARRFCCGAKAVRKWPSARP